MLLSEHVESRGRRALVAAEAQLDAGQPGRAEEQISIAKLASQSDLDVGQREVLEARLASMRGRGRDAPTLLLTAAMRLDALGGSSTRDVYHRAMIAGRAIVAADSVAGEARKSIDGSTVYGLASVARQHAIQTHLRHAHQSSE